MTTRQPVENWSSWQALDSGRLLLLAASGMLIVASLASTAVSTSHLNVRVALAFGGFVALGELLRLALPGGREAAPIAMAGAMAYAMLLTVSGQPTTRESSLGVIAVAAIGMIVGALPHIAAGRSAGVTGMCTRLVAVTCVAFIFRPIVVHTGIWRLHQWWIALAVMALLVLVGWLADTVISALIRADDVRARFSVSLWDEMRVQWPLGAAVGASAIIMVFAAEVMGLWELVVFIGPLLVTQVAFRRYAGIRATYLQTVRWRSRSAVSSAWLSRICSAWSTPR